MQGNKLPVNITNRHTIAGIRKLPTINDLVDVLTEVTGVSPQWAAALIVRAHTLGVDELLHLNNRIYLEGEKRER